MNLKEEIRVRAGLLQEVYVNNNVSFKDVFSSEQQKLLIPKFLAALKTANVKTQINVTHRDENWNFMQENGLNNYDVKNIAKSLHATDVKGIYAANNVDTEKVKEDNVFGTIITAIKSVPLKDKSVQCYIKIRASENTRQKGTYFFDVYSIKENLTAEQKKVMRQERFGNKK